MPQTCDTGAWHPLVWQLWAKSGEDGKWLSIPQHMRDSAAIAGLLWEHWISDSLRNLLSVETGLEAPELRTLVQWLAGVHDVGKIDSEFIRQIENRPECAWLVGQARSAGLEFRTKSTSRRIPHSHISDVLVAEYLVDQAALRHKRAVSFSAVVGSHHGLPIPLSERKRAQEHVEWLPPPWRELQQNALSTMASETTFDDILPRLPDGLSAPAQMILSGLVIMTDWIASNTEACPLSTTGHDFNGARGEEALGRIDPTPAWRPSPPSVPAGEAYAVRFGWSESRRARPVQSLALELAQGMAHGEGGLLAVEAPMGEGKTELALLCSEILAQRNGSGGIMVAAPTMATADGLLRRVEDWAEAAMAHGIDVASLFLAHSKSRLNKQYRGLPTLKEIHDAQGAVVAHQWLSGRKKGILANAVVGTVDQVLFMALQSKHMMLRHLGLGQKVVVIDEVHAYDAYMSQYLERALTWLGHYKAPVILLSATLARSSKERLVSAYVQGLNRSRKSVPQDEPEDSYPAITVAHRGGVSAYAVAPREQDQTVHLRILEEGDEAIRCALQQTADEGGCTAVVCSTVDRAQRAFAIAQQLVGSDAVLLHSRFVAGDRAAKESALLDELGPASSRRAGTRPPRRIVVATQVIEQSLDVDFDHMITDIAPSDLILQRVGRIHRHERPESDRPGWARTPTVRLRGFTSAPSATVPPIFDDLVSLIYPEHLLLSSCTALGLIEEAPCLTLPTEIPRVVHETYEEPRIPEHWRDQADCALTTYESAREQAARRASTFRLDRPRPATTLTHLFGNLADDVDRDDWGEQRGLAQVRDTDPTLEVLLVQKTSLGYRPLPWLVDGESQEVYEGREPSWETAQILASSSVRLPRFFSQEWVITKAIESLERETDISWRQHPLLRGQLMLRLDDEGAAVLLGRKLRYDRELGLIDLDAGRDGPAAARDGKEA